MWLSNMSSILQLLNAQQLNWHRMQFSDDSCQLKMQLKHYYFICLHVRYLKTEDCVQSFCIIIQSVLIRFCCLKNIDYNKVANQTTINSVKGKPWIKWVFIHDSKGGVNRFLSFFHHNRNIPVSLVSMKAKLEHHGDCMRMASMVGNKRRRTWGRSQRWSADSHKHQSPTDCHYALPTFARASGCSDLAETPVVRNQQVMYSVGTIYWPSESSGMSNGIFNLILGP